MEPRRYGPFPYTPITQRPEVRWPDGARLALWVAPNIEFFPLDEKVFFGAGMVPDVLAWSHRDYGARVGIFRIMEVLDKYGIRGTVALNSEVCDAYPQIIDESMKRNWEFIGHNQSNSRPLNPGRAGSRGRRDPGDVRPHRAGNRQAAARLAKRRPHRDLEYPRPSDRCRMRVCL